MEKLKHLIEKFSFFHKIKTIMGIALFVLLIICYLFPNNKIVILTACIAGGLINVINGLELMKDPKRMMTGMTFLMMGVIIIIVGFIIIK